MLQKVTTGLAIAAIVIVAIFAINNLDTVEVSFLFWSINVSKIVVILGSYLLGMLTGGGLFHLIKKYLQQSKSKKSGAGKQAVETKSDPE